VYYYRKDYNIVDEYSIEVVISNNIVARGTIVGPNTKVIKGITKRVTIRVNKSFIEIVIIL
jgi:phosphoribosylformimino-5-aminoimidazole carboxamide ribonucleotide (ProFAR) isomerase